MLNSNSYRCTERAAPRAVTQQHSAKLHHYVQFSALLNERQQEEVTHTQTRRRRHLHTAARGQSSADMVDGMKCTLTPWNSTTPGNSITDYYHLFVFAKGKKTFLKLFIWRLVWSCSRAEPSAMIFVWPPAVWGWSQRAVQEAGIHLQSQMLSLPFVTHMLTAARQKQSKHKTKLHAFCFLFGFSYLKEIL